MGRVADYADLLSPHAWHHTHPHQLLSSLQVGEPSLGSSRNAFVGFCEPSCWVSGTQIWIPRCLVCGTQIWVPRRTRFLGSRRTRFLGSRNPDLGSAKNPVVGFCEPSFWVPCLLGSRNIAGFAEPGFWVPCLLGSRNPISATLRH
ncbi:hypothetical protein SLEP1_g9348 [Rubroshorea leprosula]|uniref:Uncharacterized protein n=1 Tax=Rubroshorea leprosula TaxID=152421 RepID=A0AAV5I4M5_9ROSI|nr:hypothetical protein SLEP1_g9348 [Rubroshorea leprosula]